MTTEEFWTIIESAKGASQDVAGRAVGKTLKRLKPEQIVEFKKQFDARMREAYTWDLWGAAYVMQGGCSDDGFEYFRAWLISQGRSTFEAVVRDPESLAALRIKDPEECEFESLIYAAAEAYEAATGRELPMPAERPPTEPTGNAWSEDDTDELRRRFPKLFKKFASVWGQ